MERDLLPARPSRKKVPVLLRPTSSDYRDQQHVLSNANRETVRRLVRRGPQRLLLHAQGEPEDHSLQALAQCLRRYEFLPGQRRGPEGKAGSDPRPVAAELQERPRRVGRLSRQVRGKGKTGLRVQK